MSRRSDFGRGAGGHRVDQRARRAPGGWLALGLLLSALPVLGAASSLPPESPAWFEVQAPDFTLIANVDEPRAMELARDLEAFRDMFEREVPGLRGASRSLTIYALDSRRTLRRYYPSAPRAVGGVFLHGEHGDFVLIDAGTAARQQHAYHEYVHFRLRDSFHALPAWLNEGLAYYFQTFRRVGAGAEVGGSVPGLGGKRATPLATLLDATAADDGYATRSFARGAWELVHYLQSRSGDGEPPLARLLAAQADGRRGEAALSETLGLTPAAVEAALDAHVSGGGLRARPVTIERPEPESVPAAQPLNYAAVLVRLGELSEAVDLDAGSAKALFDEALSRAPDDPRALLGSARALVNVGDLAGAAARVNTALEQEPQNPLGYLLRGTIAMGDFSAWRATRPDGAAQVLHPSIVDARHAFQHAMSLDPALLPAVRGYARTFLFDPTTRAPGIEACTSALAKREDLDLALTLVELHSDDADRESAHATRREHVLPWRDSLSLHGSTDEPAPWSRVENALAGYDMLLAERQYEKGLIDEALGVLHTARAAATGQARERISALLAEMSARPRR